MAIVSMRDEAGRRWYFIWSSITDSPTSPAMSLAELQAYVRRQAADRAAVELQRALPRIMERGTSELNRESAKETVEPCNCAGEGGTWLTAEQQLALAIRWRKDPDATLPGVPQDMICCMCVSPIPDGERRFMGDGDDEGGDAWCPRCFSEAIIGT